MYFTLYQCRYIVNVLFEEKRYYKFTLFQFASSEITLFIVENILCCICITFLHSVHLAPNLERPMAVLLTPLYDKRTRDCDWPRWLAF